MMGEKVKGIVFTEFMEMIESQFGLEMVDKLIEKTSPPSGAVYTTVGTYEFDELYAYIVELNTITDIPVNTLIQSFGHHLGKAFTQKFTTFFDEAQGTINFLKRIHDHIHVEVQKLYPDAELPEFTFDDSKEHEFILTYRSTRGLADLAQGLIESTMAYYNETFSFTRKNDIEGIFHISEFRFALH